MDEIRCLVAGDTTVAPGGLGTMPAKPRDPWLHGRGWEFGIPVEPAMALREGAKGKDPAGPGESSPSPPGTEGTAQAGAWCQGPCPGSAREEFQLHVCGRGGRGARLLPEHPLPAAGFPGITSIYWAVHAAPQSCPQPRCPLRQGPCPLPAALMGPSGRRLCAPTEITPLSRAQS